MPTREEIMSRLDEWAQNPGAMDEDGNQSPLAEPIQHCRYFLVDCGLLGPNRQPDSLVSDAEGGISAFWYCGEVTIEMNWVKDHAFEDERRCLTISHNSKWIWEALE